MAVQTDPYTFTNGTVADADEVNSRFNLLYTLQNGGIDADNLDLTDAYTWTGAHSFGSTLGVTGAATLSSTLGVTGITTLSNDVKLAATKKFFPDGGGDTYLYESSANVFDIVVGGTLIFRISNGAGVESGNFYVAPTAKVYFDNGGDTYFTESSANVLDLYVGGTLAHKVNSSGETLLADVDPPTANYANMNGIVKGWVVFTTDGSTSPITATDSYNVSSITTSGSPNIVNWNTDFGDADYVVTGGFYSATGTHTAVEFYDRLAGSVTMTAREIVSGNYDNTGAYSILAIGNQ